MCGTGSSILLGFVNAREVGVSSRNLVSRTFPQIFQSMLTPMPSGELNSDQFQRAILQYGNTPDKDTKFSPAMCIFGHPICDFIPILPGRYIPHTTGCQTLSAREEALRICHMKDAERWTEHTKSIPYRH